RTCSTPESRDMSLVTSSRSRLLGIDAVEKREALFKVESRRYVRQRYSKLHHRKGHVGLNADNDRMRASQTDHVREITQRARGERIQHIKGCDIDNDASRAEPADFLDQGIAQMHEVLVGQRCLDRRDQVIG